MDKRDYRKIIVVDDTVSVANAVEGILNENGFLNTETYNDPFEAFAAIQKSKPVCVITDYRMPGMSGVELLNKVEAIDSAVKGIIITADPHEVRDINGKYQILDKNQGFFEKIADVVKQISEFNPTKSMD